MNRLVREINRNSLCVSKCFSPNNQLVKQQLKLGISIAGTEPPFVKKGKALVMKIGNYLVWADF
jgi:hypothetical protein